MAAMTLTPDDLARLLLPATPALLEGWCGPVVLEFDDGVRVKAAHNEVNSRDCAIHLDLARAECRDRVARVAFWTVGLPRCWTYYRAGVAMGVGFMLGDDGRRWASGPWIDGGQGHSRDCLCPALADLDPNDPRRLPDGSRYVDALAERLVAEEVLCG